ncbi:unnamed protein product [Tenebrio molitor]|nr:unnamed protein product [Tenebrio molitor]
MAEFRPDLMKCANRGTVVCGFCEVSFENWHFNTQQHRTK